MEDEKSFGRARRRLILMEDSAGRHTEGKSITLFRLTGAVVKLFPALIGHLEISVYVLMLFRAVVDDSRQRCIGSRGLYNPRNRKSSWVLHQMPPLFNLVGDACCLAVAAPMLLLLYSATQHALAKVHVGTFRLCKLLRSNALPDAGVSVIMYDCPNVLRGFFYDSPVYQSSDGCRMAGLLGNNINRLLHPRFVPFVALVILLIS